LQDLKRDPRRRKDKEIIELLRKVLNVITEDRDAFKRKVDRLKESPKKLSVFPPELRDNITDLVRHRNAVSHRTMVPIGSYEALRSVYCLMSLVMWWGKEKTVINREDDPDTIMRNSIKRNSGVAT